MGSLYQRRVFRGSCNSAI